MKGDLLVVMWHSIVPAEGVFVSGIKVAGEECPFERFLRQLKALQKEFFIISLDQLWQIGIANLPEKSVLLTFDDGLKSQYEILPILQEMEIPALFSVPIDPLNGIIPATFKLQLIGGEESGIDLQDLRENVFPKIMKEHGLEEHLGNVRIPDNNYRIEPQELREIKYICNMRLGPNEKNAVVNEMFNLFFPLGSEWELCQQMFMTDKEVQSLFRAEMGIASHGISHHLFSSLRSNDLEKELKGSKNILENIIGSFNSVFAFTYPSAFSGDKQIEETVKETYRFAFAYDGKAKINSPPFDPWCIHRIHEADLEKFVSF